MDEVLRRRPARFPGSQTRTGETEQSIPAALRSRLPVSALALTLRWHTESCRPKPCALPLQIALLHPRAVGPAPKTSCIVPVLPAGRWQSCLQNRPLSRMQPGLPCAPAGHWSLLWCHAVPPLLAPVRSAGLLSTLRYQDPAEWKLVLIPGTRRPHSTRSQ